LQGLEIVVAAMTNMLRNENLDFVHLREDETDSIWECRLSQYEISGNQSRELTTESDLSL
jgi:hypothetical protein